MNAVRNGTAMELNEALPCRTACTSLANKLLSERSQTPKTTDSVIYMAMFKTRKNTLEGRIRESGSFGGGQT